MDEKMIIALIPVREKGKESTIPVGFSVAANLIPAGLKPMEVHFDNYVKIEVRGHQPVTAMIVVVAEDSRDLLAGYKIFINRSKIHKLGNLPSKISYWLSLSNAELKKFREFTVKAVTKAEFNSFIKLFAEKPINISCQPDVISLDENSNSASTSGKSSNLEEGDENKVINDLIAVTKEKIRKIKEVSEFIALTNAQKEFFRDLTFIQENMIKIFSHLKQLKFQVYPAVAVKKESKDSSTKDLRFIAEEESTKKINDITLVEGLLPVKSAKYKRFLKSLPKNILDREPNAVITNFVKLCFPNHWITGVTVAGKGNNKSLLSIWNYELPLTNPVSGKIDETLGKARFDALIDHTLRKCGRKSYDSVTVGALHNQICKTMYYQRTRIKVRKGSRGTKDTTTESEDMEDEDLEGLYGDDLVEDSDEEDDDDDDNDDSDDEDDEDTEENDDDDDNNENDENVGNRPKSVAQDSITTISAENEDHEIAMNTDSDVPKVSEKSNENLGDKGEESGGGITQQISGKISENRKKSLSELLVSEVDKSNNDQQSLFDDADDPFLEAMYSGDVEIMQESPVSADRRATSTPAKLSAVKPLSVNLPPITCKLNLSSSSSKSQPDLPDKSCNSKTSDSGFGTSDVSINNPKKELVTREPTTNQPGTSDSSQDVDQGTKRKTSEASDIGSNKVQKVEVQRDSQVSGTLSPVVTETPKVVSTSAESTAQSSAPVNPDIMALLANPENQKLLAGLFAQLAKK